MLKIRVFYTDPEDRRTLGAAFVKQRFSADDNKHEEHTAADLQGRGGSKYDAIYDLLRNELGIEVANFPKFEIVDERKISGES